MHIYLKLYFFMEESGTEEEAESRRQEGTKRLKVMLRGLEK